MQIITGTDLFHVRFTTLNITINGRKHGVSFFNESNIVSLGKGL